MSVDDRRLQLALPFTLLTEADTLRLLGGEDVRLTLRGDGVDRWGPAVLASLERDSVGQVVAAHGEPARALIEQLLGERALVPAAPAVRGGGEHVAQVDGAGPLADRVRGRVADRPLPLPTAILVQQTMDYAAALRWDEAQAGARLWVSCGAVQRGYVSPLFVPDAGPCLRCLIDGFERRSPAPELHRALLESDAPLATADFTPEGLDVLAAILGAKLAQAALPQPPSSLFALHVVELPGLETTTHAVSLDPACTRHR